MYMSSARAITTMTAKVDKEAANDARDSFRLSRAAVLRLTKSVLTTLRLDGTQRPSPLPGVPRKLNHTQHSLCNDAPSQPLSSPVI